MRNQPGRGAVGIDMVLGALVVVIGVSGQLIAEAKNARWLRGVAKPLASAGFLLAALGAPALRAPAGVGWLLFAALVAAVAGDLLLLGCGKRWFIGGMAAFSLTHLGYIAWFSANGLHPVGLALAVAVMMIVGHLAWRWLEGHLEGAIRVPLRAYVALVSLMTAFALGFVVQQIAAAGLSSAVLPALGGVLFCASDVAVARQRFVRPAFVNKAWGLTAYYTAQLLFASAVL